MFRMRNRQVDFGQLISVNQMFIFNDLPMILRYKKNNKKVEEPTRIWIYKKHDDEPP